MSYDNIYIKYVIKVKLIKMSKQNTQKPRNIDFGGIRYHWPHILYRINEDVLGLVNHTFAKSFKFGFCESTILRLFEVQ